MLRRLRVASDPRSAPPSMRDSTGRGVPGRPVARPAALLTALRPRGGACGRETLPCPWVCMRAMGGWGTPGLVGAPHVARSLRLVSALGRPLPRGSWHASVAAAGPQSGTGSMVLSSAGLWSPPMESRTGASPHRTVGKGDVEVGLLVRASLCTDPGSPPPSPGRTVWRCCV